MLNLIIDVKPKPKLPECVCNLEGRQSNENGDWCWLANSPCILMNRAGTTNSKDTWVECEKKGKKQIDCGGKKHVYAMHIALFKVI